MKCTFAAAALLMVGLVGGAYAHEDDRDDDRGERSECEGHENDHGAGSSIERKAAAYTLSTGLSAASCKDPKRLRAGLRYTLNAESAGKMEGKRGGQCRGGKIDLTKFAGVLATGKSEWAELCQRGRKEAFLVSADVLTEKGGSATSPMAAENLAYRPGAPACGPANCESSYALAEVQPQLQKALLSVSAPTKAAPLTKQAFATDARAARAAIDTRAYDAAVKDVGETFDAAISFGVKCGWRQAPQDLSAIEKAKEALSLPQLDAAASVPAATANKTPAAAALVK